MSCSKPLTYPSAMCVMQQMEPNWRFFLVSRLPPLLKLHQTTPLHIRTLKLCTESFSVNNLDYNFYAEFDSNLEELPDDFKRENRAIDYFRDFDANEMNQDLQQNDIQTEGFEDEQDEREELNALDLEHTSHVVCKYNESDMSRYWPTEFHFPTGSRIRNVIRQQIAKFFGGGTRVASIAHFECGSNFRGILRIPDGLKLRIGDFYVNGDGNSMINGMRKIMDESSFPLRLLRVNVNWVDDPVLQNPIFLNVGSEIHVQCDEFPHGTSLAHFLVALPTKTIRINGFGLPAGDIIAIASSWFQKPKEIGSRFTANFESIVEVRNGLKEKFGVKKGRIELASRPHKLVDCLVIPINQKSELVIYHERWGYRNFWRVTMKVMVSGTAQIIGY